MSGSPTETSLITLDRKLEAMIKECRAKAPKKASDAEVEPSLRLNSTGGPMASDARS